MIAENEFTHEQFTTINKNGMPSIYVGRFMLKTTHLIDYFYYASSNFVSFPFKRQILNKLIFLGDTFDIQLEQKIYHTK